METNSNDRKAVLIVMLVCGILMGVGILLIATANGSGTRLGIGVFLAVLFGLFLVMIYRVGANRGLFGKASSGNWGSLVDEAAVRKRAGILSLCVMLLSVAAVALWFTPLLLFVGITLVLGSVGALLLVYRGPKEVQGLAALSGSLIGIVMTVISRRSESNVYEYYVNNVRVGSGSDTLTNTLLGALATIVLVHIIILGVAFGIRKLSSMKRV